MITRPLIRPLYKLVRHASTKSKDMPDGKLESCYNAALNYLNAYKESHLKQAESLKQKLSSVDGSKRLEIEKQIKALEIEAYIHQPEVEKAFKDGTYGKEPVFRYLKQKEWEENKLKILEQRLTQMFVKPDLIHPKTNLEIRLNVVSEEGALEPGVKIEAEKMLELPKFEVSALHSETKLYTLVLVDPDYPDEANKCYKNAGLFMVNNIPINENTDYIPIEQGTVAYEYIPPHPFQNTGTHRYTLLLLEQKNGKVTLETIPKHPLGEPLQAERTFYGPEFLKKYNLEVKGATFVRCQYGEGSAVRKVVDEILGINEPIYGPVPQVNPRVGKDGIVRNRYHNL